MAVNVDSPKRRSLRLQDANADVDRETPSISSGANRPANARTSGNEKRLSSERRIDTAGQERSLSKRRSTEPPHKENDTDRKEKRGSSTNTMGPNTAKSTQPMEPNTIEPLRVQSPGRRSHHSSSLHAADSSRAAMDNTSFSRQTRSRKAKNIEAGMANKRATEDAISSKEKNDNTHLDQRNEQGSEDSGEISSQNKSLRARRSHDSSTTNRGAPETNTLLKRQSRSSGGRGHVDAEDFVATRSKGATSKTENAHHAEARSPKKLIAEDPDRSNRRNRSYDVEDSSTNNRGTADTNPLLKRQSRSSGGRVNVEAEDSVATRSKGAVSKTENAHHAEARSPKKCFTEDPDRSNRHNRSYDVEDSSTTNRGAAETNPLLKRQNRSSGGRGHVEAEDSVATRSKGATSKTENAQHAEARSPKKCIAEDPDRSNRRNKSYDVEDSSTTTTQTLKRKTRASGANLEEPAVVKQDESPVLSKKNPKLSETSLEDGSTTTQMLKRKTRASGANLDEPAVVKQDESPVSSKKNPKLSETSLEDGSTTTQMLKRKTRASGANLKEPSVVKQDESVVLSKLSETSFQQGKGSEDPGRSNRHNRSCDVEDGSTTTTQMLKRKTRTSGANLEEPAVVKQDESPVLSKKNPKLSEISIQQGEGYSYKVENSSSSTQMLKRKTRASGANLEEPAIVKQDEGVALSKQSPKLSETSFQQGKRSEDPGGSNSHNKSCNVEDSSTTSKKNPKLSEISIQQGEGYSYKVENSSSSTQMLKRKTRASGANLEEPAVVKQDESIVLSQQNPKLCETNFQQGEGSEDPDGSNSHINLRPRRNDNSNVEDSPRRSGVSTGANASFNKETRSSKAKNYEESGASSAVQGIGVPAVSSQKRKSVHFSKTDHHENQRSDGLDWRESYTRSLQKLEDHTDASDHIKDYPKGSSLPTKSCDLASEDGRSSREKDKEAGASTERDNNNELVSQEERIGRPSNHREKETDVSCGVRSPRKNLTPRRSHNGFGLRSETSERTPSKDKGGTEPPVHSGEVVRVPGESISPRKRLQKTLNFEDPADETRQPSNVTSENDTGGAARDYKVQCCSKQLLKEVLGMCTGICEEILDSQQYLNPEQKQQHHKNLAWDFETAFQENVSLRGMSWHEAPDEDSEPDVEILEEQMDEAIVRTSMKRRRYPRKILSQFVKALKTEREILNQYKPIVNPKRVSLDPAIECRMKELSTTAATVCQHIHETKKALPIQLEKAAGFSQVLNLQPSLAESRIRKDIFYSRVVLEDISKSTPKVLETTLPQSEPKDLATPVRNLRKRRVSLPQRHLYPIRSKRKINLES